jgi:hypothetical protein
MRIVSFYTLETPYAAEADTLRASLDALGITHYSITGCPNRGSWDLNTKWKPMVILKALNDSDDDVLYVDADATFHAVPDLSFCAGVDLAAHLMDKAFWGQDTSKRRYSLMSGTLYVGNTDRARELMLLWAAENKLEPKRWDQQTLETVLKYDPMNGSITRKDVAFANLPCQYCAIDKTMHGIDDAVIRHHQASRRLKRRIG